MEHVAVREEGFIVKSKTDDLQREINATVLNAGEAGWTDVPVVFSATNLQGDDLDGICLLYTSPSPRDRQKSRMPSSA